MTEPQKIIEFKIPSVPLGQPRVKATRRGPNTGVYTPTKTSTGKSNGVAELKAMIRLVASQVFTQAPLSGPLRVDLDFVFPRQSSMVWKKRPMPRYRKITKPDRDNCDKLVCDALTGLVWVDDNQICDGRIQKWHCAGDEQPHILVRVEVLELM